MDNRCVMCGEMIPEGRMVCLYCEEKARGGENEQRGIRGSEDQRTEERRNSAKRRGLAGGAALRRLAVYLRRKRSILHDQPAAGGVQQRTGSEAVRKRPEELPGDPGKQPDGKLQRVQMVPERKTGAELRLQGIHLLDPASDLRMETDGSRGDKPMEHGKQLESKR